MDDVYERLRERLDMFPQGFPKTGSGVELEILQRLFTPEEAEIMLHLRPYPEQVSDISARAERDESKLGEILYDMSKRGLILRLQLPKEQMLYFLAPWMIGIWEFQLNNLDDENIRLYEQYYKEGIVPAARDFKTPLVRVIPIEKEIQGSTEIQPYEKVSEIVESHSKFAVADCICRKEAKMVGDGCDKLMEACMTFGAAAYYYIENGLGREISKEEAKEILLRTEQEGLVHCSSNDSDDKAFICNCCGCCCKALAHLNRYNNPGIVAKSNYYAVLDEDTCTGCETCIDRCQAGATRIEDDRAVIDKQKCIGCGLCVSTCPTDSISMVHKSSDELSPVFSNQMELMQAIGRDKGKVFPFE